MAGLHLGTAILAKLFPLVIAMLLLLKRRWQTLASTVFVAVTGTVAVSLYHPEFTLTYFLT